MNLELSGPAANFRARMKQFSVKTARRTQFIDITDEVLQLATENKWRDGALFVFVPHTTAGITINEHADPDVARDLERRLDHMIPWEDAGDRHQEGNTAAHLKASFMGASAFVRLQNGKLQLGTWQGVFLCEFDGPRTRQIWVSFNA